MTSLNNIIYEDVAPGYGRVAYLGFSLLIKKENGYVNATHLCAQSEKKREFKNWIRLDHAQELIDDLCSSAHKRADELTQVPGGLPNELRGTYVHPMLVPVIAQWASPRFRTRVAVILKSEAEREYRLALAKKDDVIHEINKKLDIQSVKIDNLQAINENQTHKIDNLQAINENQTHKIDNLQAINEKQSSQIAQLLGYAHKADAKLDVVVGVAATTALDLDIVNDKVDELRERLETERVVPPRDASFVHTLGVVQTSATTLSVIRTQQNGYRRALAALKRHHPDMLALREFTPTANSINLLIRFKEYVRAHEMAGVAWRYRTITFDPAVVGAGTLVNIFDTLSKDATDVGELDTIDAETKRACVSLKTCST